MNTAFECHKGMICGPKERGDDMCQIISKYSIFVSLIGLSEFLTTGKTASKAVRSSIQRPTRVSGHAQAEFSRQESPRAQGPCDQRSNARDDSGARYREGAGAQEPSDLRWERWRGPWEGCSGEVGGPAGWRRETMASVVRLCWLWRTRCRGGGHTYLIMWRPSSRPRRHLFAGTAVSR